MSLELDFWHTIIEYRKDNPAQRLGQAIENVANEYYGIDCGKSAPDFSSPVCCFQDDNKIPLFMMHFFAALPL